MQILYEKVHQLGQGGVLQGGEHAGFGFKLADQPLSVAAIDTHRLHLPDDPVLPFEVLIFG